MFSAPKPTFAYTDAFGKKQSVQVVDKYYPKKIVEPFAKVDGNIDPKLRRAATIAQERARAHSLSKCWHFVKEALVAAGVVKSRPQTTLAKQAGHSVCGADALSLSAGAAFFPKDGSNAEQLLTEADRQMYAAKRLHYAQAS